MDDRLQQLARAAQADPADAHAAHLYACALIRAGQGPRFAEFLTPPSEPYGHWDGPVFARRYRLSIQASNFNYSTPRRDGLAAEAYTAWEVAVVDYQAEGPSGLVYVLDSETFKGMPYADHWEGEGAVGPYVPAEGVQAIFDWMTCALGRPEPSSVLALED